LYVRRRLTPQCRGIRGKALLDEMRQLRGDKACGLPGLLVRTQTRQNPARCPIPEDARENLWFCGCGVAEPLRWNWAGWLRLRLGDQGSEPCCNLLVGASPRSVSVPVLRVEMDRMDRIFKQVWLELYRSPGRVVNSFSA